MHNVFHFAQRNAAVGLTVVLLAASTGGAAMAQSADTLTLGGGVAAGPRYSGSSEHSVGPVLLIDYGMANGFFASTMRGLGYGGQVDAFSYSAALGYRGQRTQKNELASFGNSGGSRLRGMGDVKGNASALLGMGYALTHEIELSLSADVPLSQKDNGANFHAQVSGQLYAGGQDRLVLGAGAGFADGKYAQTYYGVSARQAESSRFRAYQAGSGLYEASATLTWTHQIDQRWGVTSMLGATHLMREAARSPLAERRTAPTAAVYVTYNY